MSDVVHIALCCDNAYVDYLVVTMHSILEHVPRDLHCCFHVVTPEQLHLGEREGVKALLSRHDNATIAQVPIDESAVKALLGEEDKGNFNASAYYRLLLPSLLEDIDTCLYFDCDLIACGDVTPLLTVDLGQYCAAAVKDPICGLEGKFSRHLQELLGFAYEDRYFNSGVMVLSLSKLREMDFTRRLTHLFPLSRFPFADQDVFNIVLRDQVKLLPLRYNVLIRELNLGIVHSCGCYSPSELADVDEGNAVVFHYAGPAEKPWRSIQSTCSLPWVECAQDILATRSWEGVLEGFKDYSRRGSLASIAVFCRSAQAVYLYGFSVHSRALADWLLEAGIPPIRGFFDSDKDKIGKEYRSIPCLDAREVANVVGESDRVVIAAQTAFSGIQKELVRQGIQLEALACFRRKERAYYRNLRSDWYEWEIENIQRDLACFEDQRYASLVNASPAEFISIIRGARFEPLRDALFCSEWILRSEEDAR